MANHKWTDAEKQFIIANANVLTDEKAAAQLSRLSGRKITVGCYRKQRVALGIKKKHGRGINEVNNETSRF